jgi:hypothetical protein
MKTLPVSVALPCLVAISLLCLGVFQACQTPLHTTATPPPDPSGGPDPVKWYSQEPVFIKKGGETPAEKRTYLKTLLVKHSKSSVSDFCQRPHGNPNGYGRECSDVPDPKHPHRRGQTVALILANVSTNKTEKTHELNKEGTAEDRAAIHVAQNVDFADPADKKNFIQDLGY